MNLNTANYVFVFKSVARLINLKFSPKKGIDNSSNKYVLSFIMGTYTNLFYVSCKKCTYFIYFIYYQV